MTKMTLLLLTQPATNVLAWHAFRLAQALLNTNQKITVFFYQDAVNIANNLTWRPQDEQNLGQAWQSLNIDLPICVTAALNRGISDSDNAKRHQLESCNLMTGFRMAGLGELADQMLSAQHVLHF